MTTRELLKVVEKALIGHDQLAVSKIFSLLREEGVEETIFLPAKVKWAKQTWTPIHHSSKTKCSMSWFYRDALYEQVDMQLHASQAFRATDSGHYPLGFVNFTFSIMSWSRMFPPSGLSMQEAVSLLGMDPDEVWKWIKEKMSEHETAPANR